MAVNQQIEVAPKDMVWQVLQRNRATIEKISQGRNAERTIIGAYQQWAKQEKLRNCDPTTVIDSVLKAVQLGMSLTPGSKQGYLVPIWNRKEKKYDCDLWLGYPGLVEIVLRNPKLSHVTTGVIRPGDHVNRKTGTTEFLEITPAEEDNSTLPATHFWAVLHFVNGRSMHEVMSRSQVEAIRAQVWKMRGITSAEGDYTPWATGFDEMGRKTVLRRLLKPIPMPEEINDTLNKMDADEFAATVEPTAVQKPEPPKRLGDWQPAPIPEQKTTAAPAKRGRPPLSKTAPKAEAVPQNDPVPSTESDPEPPEDLYDEPSGEPVQPPSDNELDSSFEG